MAWRVFMHCLVGVAQGGLLCPPLSKPQRDRRIQKWTRTILKRVGVELKVISAHAPAGPVQPVTLQMVEGRSGRPCQAVSYMGDESLAGSVWRTLCARELCAVVTFGAPQRAGGRDRRAWAQDLHLEIGAMRSREAPRSP
jgi:hypothetical protein